ncbi:MAG TPA: aminopeptidase [Gemmatimonadaceae bacterium]|nr:aminopeptidase [Gemmatimonadaceae bacterium]
MTPLVAGVRRVVKRLVAGLTIAVVLFLALTPTGCYLSRAGWEEARILAGRKEISRLVEDPGTDRATRLKLELVLAARAFARDSIGLDVGESFTTYSRLRRDTLVLVLSAAYRDRLEPHTWWFPIVGRVPYKGFFDFGAAQRAARDLQADGLDTYLRPSAAFSTLGWFNDPLLSTTLRYDSLDLANTVIHEVTHNTFYAPGQAVFNESFATFVGAHGGEWFFRAQGDSVRARIAALDWEDDKALGRFWTALWRQLDSAYRAHPESREARLAARDTIYARARVVLVDSVGPQLRRVDPRALARVQLDNAALLARRIYLTDLDAFERVYEAEGRDLRRAITRVMSLAKRRPEDPYAELRAWVERVRP